MPLTDIPGISPFADTNGKVGPDGVAALVGRNTGATAGMSQVDSSDNASISFRYAIGPSGEEHCEGMQLLSEPSGLIGAKPPGAPARRVRAAQSPSRTCRSGTARIERDRAGDRLREFSAGKRRDGRRRREATCIEGFDH